MSKKRRTIPTIPFNCLSEGIEKEKYQRLMYKSILEGVEQSLETNRKSFVMARVDDGRTVKDIEILSDSFKSNLETILVFYEGEEEYELCSKTLELINQI